MLQVFLILTFMAIIISPVFAGENENGMMNIIKPTPKGLAWRTRFFVCFAAAVCVVALVSVPFFTNTLSYYGADGMDAVVQSLPAFSGFWLSISIRGYMVLLFATRVLGAATAVLVIQFISLYSRKKTTAVFVSFALLALPAAVYFVGAGFFAELGLNALLGGNALLRWGY
jgi:hypothetical protein